MGVREQFAGANLYDNAAVCLAHGHQHLIPKGTNPVALQQWLDFQHKHRGCGGDQVFILPYSALNRLGRRVAQLRDNADEKVSYAASAAYTITLTGLATSSTLITGRESSSVSNASNKYLDELVAGLITTSTSPTDAKSIEVHAIGALNDTPLWPDVFDGTDSGETITAAGVKYPICRSIALIQTNNTSDVTYPFGPMGIRQQFGDALPVAHVIFVTHNTGVNLHATAANHAIYHTPVYFTVA